MLRAKMFFTWYGCPPQLHGSLLYLLWCLFDFRGNQSLVIPVHSSLTVQMLVGSSPIASMCVTPPEASCWLHIRHVCPHRQTKAKISKRLTFKRHLQSGQCSFIVPMTLTSLGDFSKTNDTGPEPEILPWCYCLIQLTMGQVLDKGLHMLDTKYESIVC